MSNFLLYYSAEVHCKKHKNLRITVIQPNEYLELIMFRRDKISCQAKKKLLFLVLTHYATNKFELSLLSNQLIYSTYRALSHYIDWYKKKIIILCQGINSETSRWNMKLKILLIKLLIQLNTYHILPQSWILLSLLSFWLFDIQNWYHKFFRDNKWDVSNLDLST